MTQLSHHNSIFKEKNFPLVLILDGLSSPANVGSIFRLADAFNIEKMVLCGPKADLGSNRLLRTARSTLEKTDFEEYADTTEACKDYILKDYTIFALEITEDSISIDSIKFEAYSKVALLIGNERLGIDPEAIKTAHKKVHINMFGKNSSMNVAQATGIALYEITKSLPHI